VSGYVADGNRQLVWNPEFCEPAVKRLAEVSDGLFWSLPLAVSTAARRRRVGRPPASFILSTVDGTCTTRPPKRFYLRLILCVPRISSSQATRRYSLIMPPAPIRTVSCHADHELRIEAVVDGRPGRRRLGSPTCARRCSSCCTPAARAPRRLRHPDAAAVAYDDPPRYPVW